MNAKDSSGFSSSSNDWPSAQAAAIFPGGWPQRLFFFGVTVLFPALLFSLTIGFGIELTDWKKPGIQVWLELLGGYPGAGAFAPLAAALMIFCAAIVRRPGSWVARGPSRAALFTGLLLAVHYSLLLPAAMTEPLFPWTAGYVLLAVAVIEATAILFVWLLHFLNRRFGWRAVPLFVIFLWPALSCGVWLYEGLCGRSGILMDLMAFMDAVMTSLYYLLIFFLFAGPVAAADSSARLLWRLGRPHSWPVFSLLAGLAAYAASFKWALVRAAEAYIKLSETPGYDCFVATAAARAPVRLTRGFETAGADGRSFRACLQLQRFKLFELVLRELSPPGHRALRLGYDQVGPAMAARIDTPARAAIAWLALKPLEGVAVLFLWMAGGARLLEQAALLYRR